MELIVIVAIVAFVAGGLTAMLILRLLPNASSEIITSGSNERSSGSFKADVTEHFVTSAQLMEELSVAYRNVHNHLASGAQQLCQDGKPGLTPIMRKLEEQLPYEDPAANLSPDAIRPPLDYAPKSSPNEKGMLTEDFGLDRSAVKSNN